ncbi:MAG: replication initiator protein [Microvirus sp.]|nr:MAG: replication initiator protein [Microvirus sp.]
MMHGVSCMLNLTYSDEYLPQHGQLFKEDLQRFFKRLRKSGLKFRYVASGEYGDKTRRPHFHIALFGINFDFDRLPFGRSNGDITYTSETVNKNWKYGQHLIGTLNFESAAYIARYILKKIKGLQQPDPLYTDLQTGEVTYPNSEFLIMSKGIGKTWFNEFFMSDVFPHASVITSSGSKAPVPRYYKTLLKEVGSDLALEMQFRSSSRAELDLERNAFENQNHRKAARTIVNTSRSNLSKRTL